MAERNNITRALRFHFSQCTETASLSLDIRRNANKALIVVIDLLLDGEQLIDRKFYQANRYRLR